MSYDAFGSITNLTLSNENISVSYRYNEFGAIMSQSNSHQNDFTYTGRQINREAGLYYYRSRYYNSAVGRFAQKDKYYRKFLNLTMRYKNINIDFNLLYLYVENNPFKFIDPLGFSTVTPAVDDSDNNYSSWTYTENDVEEVGPRTNPSSYWVIDSTNTPITIAAQTSQTGISSSSTNTITCEYWIYTDYDSKFKDYTATHTVTGAYDRVTSITYGNEYSKSDTYKELYITTTYCGGNFCPAAEPLYGKAKNNRSNNWKTIP